tara:strand:+ start:344 stop:448 length:105 start_codon:yes stop_codon:yes gene_type:complete
MDFKNQNEYPTIADLIKKQGVSTDLADPRIRNVN